MLEASSTANFDDLWRSLRIYDLIEQVQSDILPLSRANALLEAKRHQDGSPLVRLLHAAGLLEIGFRANVLVDRYKVATEFLLPIIRHDVVHYCARALDLPLSGDLITRLEHNQRAKPSRRNEIWFTELLALDIAYRDKEIENFCSIAGKFKFDQTHFDRLKSRFSSFDWVVEALQTPRRSRDPEQQSAAGLQSFLFLAVKLQQLLHTASPSKLGFSLFALYPVLRHRHHLMLIIDTAIKAVSSKTANNSLPLAFERTALLDTLHLGQSYYAANGHLDVHDEIAAFMDRQLRSLAVEGEPFDVGQFVSLDLSTTGRGQTSSKGLLLRLRRRSDHTAMIYGDAGAGKTWLLKWLVSKLTTNHPSNKMRAQVPIYINAQEFDSAVDPIRNLAAATNLSVSTVQVLVQFYHVTILIDGVDAINSDRRTSFDRAVDQLTRLSENLSLILSSRSADDGFSNRYDTTYFIRPLTSEKAHEFIVRRGRPIKGGFLIERVSPHVQLSPLFVSVALDNQERYGEHPKNLPTALDAWIGERLDGARSRSPVQWAFDDAQRIYEDVCQWLLLRDNPTFDLPSLSKFLEIGYRKEFSDSADKLVRFFLQAGLLTERLRHYSPSHHVFLEYSAAKAALRQRGDASEIIRFLGELPNLDRASVTVETIFRSWADSRERFDVFLAQLHKYSTDQVMPGPQNAFAQLLESALAFYKDEFPSQYQRQ